MAWKPVPSFSQPFFLRCSGLRGLQTSPEHFHAFLSMNICGPFASDVLFVYDRYADAIGKGPLLFTVWDCAGQAATETSWLYDTWRLIRGTDSMVAFLGTTVIHCHHPYHPLTIFQKHSFLPSSSWGSPGSPFQETPMWIFGGNPMKSMEIPQKAKPRRNTWLVSATDTS